MGYKVTIVIENSRIDQGTVIRTIPEAGQRVPRGDSIVLVVSSGLPSVTMPNFVGKSFTYAHSKIIALRLVLGPVFSISGAVPESKRIIIRQSLPAGTEIMEQSVISFTYGTAQDYANFLNPTPTPPPFIMMPNLDRMSLASMKTLFTLRGLTSFTLSYLSAESLKLTESQLYVIEQFPAPGVQISLTESVQIRVGSMAEYNAFKNPILIPEPTPTPASQPPTPTQTPLPTPTKAPTTTPIPTPTTSTEAATEPPTAAMSSPTPT
jgi:beta-lactam-binding protein with PASTA domain